MPNQRATIVGIAAAAVAGVVAVVAVTSLRDGGVPEPAPSGLPPAVGASVDAPADAPVAPAPGALRAGETLRLQAAALADGRPFLLELAIPAPPPDAEHLAVSVFSEDRRSLALQGRIDPDDRERASVSLEAGWLATPGRYVVQVETGESSHFPIRRYAIEVR